MKRLDYPPAKRTKAVPPAPEFHIAVNLEPTLGESGSALQGKCIVSGAPIPNAGSASAPGFSRLERVTALEGSSSAPGPSSAPDPQLVGRKAYIPTARTMLLEMLLECAKTGRVPSSRAILTWMDVECPDVDGDFMESYSDFETFGIGDAFDIMEREVMYLATFGNLGEGGAMRLRQYTQDRILTPLGLWATDCESIGSKKGDVSLDKIFNWRNGVEEGYVEEVQGAASVEEVEEASVVEVEKVEEVEEVDGGGAADIEEIEGWSESELTMKEYNYGQWEEEV